MLGAQTIDGATAKKKLEDIEPKNKFQKASLLAKSKGLLDALPKEEKEASKGGRKESLKEKVARQQAAEEAQAAGS